MLKLFTAKEELVFATWEELQAYFDKLDKERTRKKQKKPPHYIIQSTEPIKVDFD